MKQSLKFLKSLLLLIKRILIFMVGGFLILLLGVWVLKIDCHELGKIFFDSEIEEINPLMRGHVSYLIDVDGKTIETYDRGLYTDIDPLIVSLVLTGYETKNLENIEWTVFPIWDEGRILVKKFSGINYVYFSVPRWPGKYSFNAKLNYYTGESVNTYDLIGGPILTFLPDDKMLDIPMVTLKTNKTNVEVGEEITFEVISEVASNRDDFEDKRIIQMDFDGDGEYDLTTKDTVIKYSYTKPSPWSIPYEPVASVIYNDYRGIGEGAPIFVTKSGDEMEIEEVEEIEKVDDRDYNLAKDEIISILPLASRHQINSLFTALESTESNGERSTILESINRQILEISSQAKDIEENEIYYEDYQSIVRPNICFMAERYDIALGLCDGDNVDVDMYTSTVVDPEPARGIPAFVKLLCWLLVVITIGFLATLLYYSRRHKKGTKKS